MQSQASDETLQGFHALQVVLAEVGRVLRDVVTLGTAELPAGVNFAHVSTQQVFCAEHFVANLARHFLRNVLRRNVVL